MLYLVALFVVTLQCLSSSVTSFEYLVLGDKGWIVPPPNETEIYNVWASENRFLVGDTVHFMYKKDSVMEVRQEDYKRCNSSHPRFFSNNGDTIYRLNHPGSYYFISGASGHCDKGQRMIIRVIATEGDDDGPSGGGGGGDSKKSAASPVPMPSFGIASSSVLFLFATSCVVSFVFYQ